MQAATQEWDADDTELAVPVSSIPEAPVQIGDLKPVGVVFLTSPEEFCIQVRMVLVKYVVWLVSFWTGSNLAQLLLGHTLLLGKHRAGYAE